MRLGRVSLALLGAAAATLATVVPAHAQQLRLSGVVLYNGQTDTCLESYLNSAALGSCGDSTALWNIIPDDGYNEIQNIANGLCLYNYTIGGTNLEMKSCNGDAPALWDADFVSNNTYLFQNHAVPADCLDAGQTKYLSGFFLEWNNCHLSNLYQDWVVE